MFPIAWWSAPIDTPGGRGAVLAFTDITERLAAEKAIRERDAAEIRAVESRAAQQRNLELADQQAALRRVATLVARGASPSEVFAAVSNELARVLHVVNAGLLRFEPDGRSSAFPRTKSRLGRDGVCGRTRCRQGSSPTRCRRRDGGCG
jgi:uncharacterized protein YoaH (UPF0181 family)